MVEKIPDFRWLQVNLWLSAMAFIRP